MATSMPEPDSPALDHAELMNALRAAESAVRSAQRIVQPHLPPRLPGTALFEELRKWRADQARAKAMPPYIIAPDAVLHAIEQAKPRDLEQLQAIRGMGGSRAATYGADILQIVAAASG